MTTAIPMVVMPLLFFAGLPLLIGLVPTAMNLPMGNRDILLDSMPRGLKPTSYRRPG